MSATAIAIEDMHCSACQQKIAARLRALPTVTQIRFNDIRRHVVVEHEEELAATDLIASIEDCGYHPALLQNAAPGRDDHALLKRLGIAGIAAMQVMMAHIALYAGFFSGIEDSYRRILEFTALLFCIPVVSYCALPFYYNGLVRLRRGVNMDTPIASAILIAFGVSYYNTLNGSGDVYYDSVVMFTFLILGARYLDQRLRLRLELEDALLAALPNESTLVVDGEIRQVPTRSVVPGNVLWIGEGAQLPVDGTLDADHALLDEALLSGESEWRTRTRDELIRAGTYNRGPAFRLNATSTLDDSCLAEIDQLAAAALDDKHALAHLADKVARVFVPAILLIATATYCFWRLFDPAQALSATLAVLVVSCPCALSLATPAALSAALARLRQAGVLVKNSRALERLAQTDAVLFDKTGTLTAANLQIADVIPLTDRTREECLHLAGALQAHSSHPLAGAFPATAAASVRNVKLVAGRGVQGCVDNRNVHVGDAEFCNCEPLAHGNNKTVYLAVDGVPTAVFCIDQPLRKDAEQTVAALRDHGLAVAIASGDDETHCRRVANALQIDYAAAQGPAAKVGLIEGTSQTVMFVGDGINDVPALARAGVAVATMETNALVKSKADIVLLTRRLFALVDLLHIGRKTKSVMTQNLVWAAGYNVIAIPLAAAGLAPPWLAALGMSLSSILVLLNAGRVLRVPIRHSASGG